MEVAASRANSAHWDALAGTSEAEVFRLQRLLTEGKLSFTETEISEMPDVKGRRGLHLQCGFGAESVLLTRMGAQITALDISPKTLNLAKRLFEACNIDVEVMVADVTAPLPTTPESYDFVYSANGVLRWLSSLDQWADNVYSALRPGGWFYLFEIHPLVYRLVATAPNEVTLAGDYFEAAPKHKTIKQTHLGAATGLPEVEVVHTDWPIAIVLRHLLGTGLTLRHYAEHAFTCYSRKGMLVESGVERWTLPGASAMPLSFSLLMERRI